jgi:hypothetical protein
MAEIVVRLALELRDRFGCVGIVVDAKAGAVDFYRKVDPTTVLRCMAGDGVPDSTTY